MKPLAGLAVLQQDGPAAAVLGRMLADLGATVRAERGPNATRWPAFALGKEWLAGTADEAACDLENRDAVLIADDTSPGARRIDVESWRRQASGRIAVVFSFFGRHGPWRDRPGSDRAAAALGGYLGRCGEPGRPPILPDVALMAARLAAGHGLTGLLLARRRVASGAESAASGVVVDVALRDAQALMLANAYQFAEVTGRDLARSGSGYHIGDASRVLPSIFACLDGQVVFMPLAGRAAGRTPRLVERMAAAGEAPPWLTALDWERLELADQAAVDRFIAPFAAYFARRTKAALLADALADGYMLAPVQTLAEVADDPQLADRGVWVDAGLDRPVPRSPVRIEGVDWSPPSS